MKKAKSEEKIIFGMLSFQVGHRAEEPECEDL